MKAGGSRGHRQTVMKQQCDLQLAGPMTAEQRFPHETLPSQRTSSLTASPNLGIYPCEPELNTVAAFVQTVRSDALTVVHHEAAKLSLSYTVSLGIMELFRQTNEHRVYCFLRHTDVATVSDITGQQGRALLMATLYINS